jgi:2-polyprenyl-3-methyl-5-hydroxy-6-metoxy-1,4-benzoquinol methylase
MHVTAPTTQPIDPTLLRLLLRALALPPPCRALLVAPCRSGDLCLQLAEFGFRVTGVDRDERVVAGARERAAEAGREVSFQVANTERMSFADRHFDAVLCVDFIEWLSDETERWRLVDELCRVTSRYVLVSYAAPFALGAIGERLRRLGGPHPPGTHTYRTCSLRSLRAKFSRHRFRLRTDLARLRGVHPLHLAVFQRL